MIFEYTNRKGQTHFLKVSLTKNGRERYYIVKDKVKFDKTELLADVPCGFEIYEYPEDGRVVIRKILISNITSDETGIVDAVMKKHLTAKDYIIDKDENGINVYTGHLDREEFLFDEEQFRCIQSYNCILRFEKHNNSAYKAQRFCYLSNYDGWITLETNGDLEYLAHKYCFHIDKESLLKFWIEGEEDW